MFGSTTFLVEVRVRTAQLQQQVKQFQATVIEKVGLPFLFIYFFQVQSGVVADAGLNSLYGQFPTKTRSVKQKLEMFLVRTIIVSL